MALLISAGLAIALVASRDDETAAPARSPAPPAPVAEPGCAAGCSAASAPVLSVGPERIREMLAALAKRPAGEDCGELDEVLFAWKDVAPWIEANGPGPLGKKWQEFIRRELARREVRLSVQVGEINGPKGSKTLGFQLDRVIAIGKRTHVRPDRCEGLRPPQVTLTVERTGLHHLWTRL